MATEQVVSTDDLTRLALREAMRDTPRRWALVRSWKTDADIDNRVAKFSLEEKKSYRYARNIDRLELTAEMSTLIQDSWPRDTFGSPKGSRTLQGILTKLGIDIKPRVKEIKKGIAENRKIAARNNARVALAKAAESFLEAYERSGVAAELDLADYAVTELKRFQDALRQAEA